jgi:hypothetical protein
MVLHATLDRPEAVTATWRLLHQRLGDLNLEVDAATVRMYRSLTADGSGTVDKARPIIVLR